MNNNENQNFVYTQGVDVTPDNKSNMHKKKTNKKATIFLMIIGLMFIVSISAYISYCAYLNTNNNIFSNLLDHFEDNSSASSNNSNNVINPNAPALQTEIEPSGGKTLNAEEIYKKVSPAVVGVVVQSNSANFGEETTGTGSGIIMSSDGYVITNSHVVGNTKNVKVKIVTTGEKEYSGVVVGYDSRTDVAVIKIDAKNLPCATFGDSSKVNVGSSVVAIGNPGGLDFSNTLTVGTVSAVNRNKGATNALVKYIQTDAAINQGNSGGPLLNMYGQVIGINTWKIADYEGMGFAIQINDVKSVINDIVSNGYVTGRVRLGIAGTEVSNVQMAMYGVPKGIIVAKISEDTDLSKNGLEINDIVTQVNGTSISSFDDLFVQLSKHKPGDTATLTVYKSSNRSTVHIKTRLLADKGETQN